MNIIYPKNSQLSVYDPATEVIYTEMHIAMVFGVHNTARYVL